MPSKRKQVRQEKQKKRAEEKAKIKSQDLKILLSAHAQTLQANILQLDQKAAKYTACKQLSGKF